MEECLSDAQKPLPRGFVWGLSTSAYQVEGAANEDGRGPSIWDTYSHEPGRVANGDTGDVACDHYHRYAEDIGLMRGLGIDAYRFSVSWSRVLPSGTGTVNEAGLAFYDRLIDKLLEAGIDPWLCLYHYDLPQTLQDRGGWTNRDIAKWFADYAGLIARRYGDRVKTFATFNEPSVFTFFGYAMKWQPPATDSRADHYKAIHYVNLAHGAAIDVLRGHNKGFRLGAVHNVQNCRPFGASPEDAAAADLLDEYWNRSFPAPQFHGRYSPKLAPLIEPYVQPGDMERIKRPVDFFGLNHYSPIYAKAAPGSELGLAWSDPPADVTRRSAIGWPVDPEAFRDVLLDVHRRYQHPIFVTENGAGGTDATDAPQHGPDSHRIEFLAAYTGALREAVAQGADVRGYFIWSLLDNFEWAAGYASRFGLVHVDYATQKRTPKASARWYADLIKAEKAATS